MKENQLKTSFLVLLMSMIFFTTESTFAQNSSNDAGIETKSGTIPKIHSAIASGLPSITITNTFGDLPLPMPEGVVAADNGTQQFRLFRSGNPTTCTIYGGASNFSSGNFLYESYEYVAAEDGCMNLDVTAINTSLYIGIYDGTYDPSDPALNCIGQLGASAVGSFSCPVTRGNTYILVTTETSTGGGTGANYSVTIDNVQIGPPVPVSIWATILFFVLISGYTIYKFKLKRVLFADI